MPTRKDLTRVLVVNAMTKPVNVTIPAAVLTAGLLLAVPWLIPVALVCWLALVVMTFFDDQPSEAVGQQLGCSAGNVRVIRHRGIDKLRRCVDPGRRAS